MLDRVNSNMILYTQSPKVCYPLRNDRSVICWGSERYGGDACTVEDRLYDVKKIFSNSHAFAAVKQDGTVVSWGRASDGGDSDAVQDSLVTHFENIFCYK